jgi:hypothetical protein
MGKRKAVFSASALLFCVLVGLIFSRCFTPTYSDCAFRCGTDTPSCPDEYECHSDGYCHLHGSTAVCSFTSTADLSTDLTSKSQDAATD